MGIQRHTFSHHDCIVRITCRVLSADFLHDRHIYCTTLAVSKCWLENKGHRKVVQINVNIIIGISSRHRSVSKQQTKYNVCIKQELTCLINLYNKYPHKPSVLVDKTLHTRIRRVLFCNDRHYIWPTNTNFQKIQFNVLCFSEVRTCFKLSSLLYTSYNCTLYSYSLTYCNPVTSLPEVNIVSDL